MAASTSIYQPILYWIYDQGPRREPEYRVPLLSIQLVLQKTPRVGTRQKLALRDSLKTQFPLPPITDQMLLQPYLLTTHDDTTRQGGRPARFKGDTTGALITAVARAEDCGLTLELARAKVWGRSPSRSVATVGRQGRHVRSN